MDFLVIILVSLLASLLTFFSGFGLGTLLLPAFAFFFPIQIAIPMTAIVHFANSLFKIVLVGKNANVMTVLRFGIPAFVFALIGAYLMLLLKDMPEIRQYTMGEKTYMITPIKLSIGILMMIFALWELHPLFQKLSLHEKYLPFGGMLSGFFGGLSGHQGAFRSVFLLRSGLSKLEFIGTSVVLAAIVDISRLFVYTEIWKEVEISTSWILILSAVVSALAGSVIGNQLLKKVEITFIRWCVGILLVMIGIGLGIGFI
jgi:uncharacterized membrane protein YfcA